MGTCIEESGLKSRGEVNGERENTTSRKIEAGSGMEMGNEGAEGVLTKMQCAFNKLHAFVTSKNIINRHSRICVVRKKTHGAEFLGDRGLSGNKDTG